jgi:hypothetical protein
MRLATDDEFDAVAMRIFWIHILEETGVLDLAGLTSKEELYSIRLTVIECLDNSQNLVTIEFDCCIGKFKVELVWVARALSMLSLLQLEDSVQSIEQKELFTSSC